MAQKRNLSNRSYSRTPHQSFPKTLVLPGALLAIGVFILLPLFFPLGLLWCAAIGWDIYLRMRKEGGTKVPVKNKRDMDWKKGRDRFVRYLKAEDVMEERTRSVHSHDPVSYSYDKCAQDKRMEQLKTLKEAGLLEEEEYRQRCRDILAGK